MTGDAAAVLAEDDPARQHDDGADWVVVATGATYEETSSSRSSLQLVIRCSAWRTCSAGTGTAPRT